NRGWIHTPAADRADARQELAFDIIGGALIAFLFDLRRGSAQEHGALRIGGAGQAAGAHQHIRKMLATADGIVASETYLALNRNRADAGVGEYLVKMELVPRPH